ncbi:MAG: hypothetical protein ABI591_22725 [Kofleriaceae bacterium]
MRWLLVLLLASRAAAAPLPTLPTLPTIDSQFPPAIRVTGPTKHVTIEPGDVTWVTVEVANDRYQHERELALDVPAGNRVVGLAVDDGGGIGWAARRPRWAAASDFYHGQTPTLVEAEGSSDGVDHYTVRIFDGGTYAFALCESCDGVDADTSLFFDTQRAHRGVIVDFAPGVAMSSPDLDKAIIRRVVQFQMPQFRRCLMVVGQRDRVDGNVELGFLIRDDGTTTDLTITTPPQLESARDCLAEVVGTLSFPATGTETEVHYPLTFKLDR